jgi:molecular chaperone GrpE (heat shock protein)
MTEAPDPSAIKLYLSQDQKNEVLKQEIGELRSELGEYAKRLASANRDIENTRNRLEEGVSKTAFKAWEAVGDMKTAIAQLAGRIDKLDILVGTQATAQARSDKFDDRVLYGIMLTLFTSLVVAVVAFLWSFRPAVGG